MTDKKRILVVDDNVRNLEIAREQFGDEYELVCASTSAEARKFLTPDVDEKLKEKLEKELLKKNGFPESYHFWEDEDEENKKQYFRLCVEAEKLATTLPSFSIVMTDCFIPADPDGLAERDKWEGVEVPAGLVIAILALQMNVPKIIIASDTGHHDHPIAWLMDAINNSAGHICCGCHGKQIEKDGKWTYEKDWEATLSYFS